MYANHAVLEHFMILQIQKILINAVGVMIIARNAHQLLIAKHVIVRIGLLVMGVV